MKLLKESERGRGGWYFLSIVIILYGIVWLLCADAVLPSMMFSLSIVVNIIPVFVMVFAIMALANYYITPKSVARYMSKTAGIKRWIIAIIGGIISTGPIYMWYPMLKQLKAKGLSYGFIATFLYNRAIKTPLIPMIIFYFGLKFTVILTVVIVIMSVIQGMIFERLEGGGLV